MQSRRPRKSRPTVIIQFRDIMVGVADLVADEAVLAKLETEAEIADDEESSR